jgi:hypothetical protein
MSKHYSTKDFLGDYEETKNWEIPLHNSVNGGTFQYDE